MPNTKRSSKQAARDRAALKRLRASGKYSGKIDLRKAPTRYQLNKIKTLKAAKRPRPAKTKTKGAKVRQKEISRKKLEKLSEPKHRLTTYALPFLRKGKQEPEWRRFTYKGLRQFLIEYKQDEEEAAEWQSYAVEETWTFETAAEVKTKRKDTNMYFSGIRISAPKGGVTQKRGANKKAHRGKRK